MVRNELGVGLGDWVGDLVLAKLGITDVTWVSYGRYEAAATGLSMSAVDLATVGRLLLAGGVHQGRQVVPASWIERMRYPAGARPAHTTPALRAHGYGLGLWICDGGTYYCDGTGGQFLIVVPADGDGDRRSGRGRGHADGVPVPARRAVSQVLASGCRDPSPSMAARSMA